MSNRSFRRVILLTLLAGALAGCDGGPTLSPVHGKVTFRGKPLTRGTIVFIPDAQRGGNGPLASADIEADGNYNLQTGSTPGVTPGWHRVTIMAVEPPAATAAGQRFQVPRSLIPEKYRDPELSGLNCEVKPGKENGINFNLE